jgi:parallel beta-helix repeat protein
LYLGHLSDQRENSVFQNNQLITSASSSDSIEFAAGSGNRVSGNVISGYYAGIISAGNNYIADNTVSNCTTRIGMNSTDKYRFNTTFNCVTSFSGGIAEFAENN